MGCYIWYSDEGLGRAAAPPSPLLVVLNVTAHPSTASVPITVLLYDGPLLCGFNVAIKGLSLLSVCLFRMLSSETAEWIWLKFCSGTEVCPGHCISGFVGDRPRGPTEVCPGHCISGFVGDRPRGPTKAAENVTLLLFGSH